MGNLTAYSVCATLITGCTVYSDINFTTPIVSTYFSDGTNVYQTNGSGVIISKSNCNLERPLSNTVFYSDASLIGYWPLNGNADEYDGGFNGTPTDMTYSNSYGIFNEGGLFNGTSSRITIQSTNALLFPSNFTISAWIYPTTADGTIWGRNGSLGFCFDHTGGYLKLRKGASTLMATSSAGSITQNVWQHVAVTYSGSTGAIKFYVNGVDKGGGTSIQTFSVTTWHVIGWQSLLNYFTGYIDDVSFFSRVLSASEVATIHST